MLNKKYRQITLLLRIICLFLLFIYFLQPCFSVSSNGETKNNTGMQFLADNRPAEAEIYFRQAIEENDRIEYYYNNLAVSLIQQKKYKEAITYLNKAVLINPDYVKAVSNLAVCYFYLSDYRKAYHYYKKAEKLNADYVKNRFTREKVKEKTKSIENKNYDEKKVDEIMDRMTIN